MAREIDIVILLEKGRKASDLQDYPLSQVEQQMIERAIRRLRFNGDQTVSFKILPERRLEPGSQPTIIVAGETIEYSALRLAEDN